VTHKAGDPARERPIGRPHVRPRRPADRWPFMWVPNRRVATMSAIKATLLRACA